MGLLFEDGSTPAVARGSAVLAEESTVGMITTSAVIVVDGLPRSVALAYLKRSAAAPGASLRVEGRAAKVMTLPFVF
jgi:glycine cleavage system aminomethyltransferase T